MFFALALLGLWQQALVSSVKRYFYKPGRVHTEARHLVFHWRVHPRASRLPDASIFSLIFSLPRSVTRSLLHLLNMNANSSCILWQNTWFFSPNGSFRSPWLNLDWNPYDLEVCIVPFPYSVKSSVVSCTCLLVTWGKGPGPFFSNNLTLGPEALSLSENLHGSTCCWHWYSD